MKINFTNKEFRALLTMVSIGEWVIECNQTEEREETRPIRELEQRILSLAKEFGCGHLVHYEPECDLYEPSYEFREEGDFQRYLDEYDEAGFWDALSHRLALRDAIRQEGGMERYQALDPEERMKAQDPHMERWEQEFYTHGLDRIEIQAMPLPVMGHDAEK